MYKRQVQEWVQDVFKKIEGHKIPLAYVTASFASPLMQMFGIEKSAIVETSAPTSQGKSIIQKAAASVWGNPSTLINKWDTTKIFIERRAALTNNLPYFLDDTKSLYNKRDLDVTIYQITDGAERGRAEYSGTRKIRKWNNLILSTGERKLTEYTKSEGISARVFAMYGLSLIHI